MILLRNFTDLADELGRNQVRRQRFGVSNISIHRDLTRCSYKRFFKRVQISRLIRILFVYDIFKFKHSEPETVLPCRLEKKKTLERRIQHPNPPLPRNYVTGT